MHDIPEYYRRQRMGGRSSYAPIYQVPSGGREMAQAGAVLSDFGLKVFEQFHQAEAVDQLNTFQAETQSKIDEYLQTLDPNGDPKDWAGSMEKLLAEIKSTSLAGVTNIDAQERAGDWLETQSVGWKNKVAWHALNTSLDQQMTRLELNEQTWINRAANAQTEAEYEYATSMLQKTIREAGGEGVGPNNWMLLSNDEKEFRLAQRMKQLAPQRKAITQKREEDFRRQMLYEIGETAAHIKEQSEGAGYVAVPYESESGEPELAFTDATQYMERMFKEMGASTAERSLAEKVYQSGVDRMELEEKDARADYERDYLDRLYTLPIDELLDLQKEVLARDELEPGDQQRLYKMVTDRVKAIKEDEETETEALIAGQLSDRAVRLDPNDKRAMRDFEIDVMGSDQLSDEDKASIRSTARTEFSKHQQTQLSLSHQDARNIVRPLQNKEVAVLQWLESRRTRGLPMKGKEYEKDYLQWAATRTREEEIQGIEKRISVDCTAAMNAFAATEKGQAMTPSALRKELNIILGEHIALRDQMKWLAEQGVGKKELETYERITKNVHKGPLSSPPKTVLKSHTVKDGYVQQHKQDENLKNSGYDTIPDEVWDTYSVEQVRRYMEWASEGYKLTVQDGKIGWQKP